jgi:hypothetical protein
MDPSCLIYPYGVQPLGQCGPDLSKVRTDLKSVKKRVKRCTTDTAQVLAQLIKFDVPIIIPEKTTIDMIAEYYTLINKHKPDSVFVRYIIPAWFILKYEGRELNMKGIDFKKYDDVH